MKRVILLSSREQPAPTPALLEAVAAAGAVAAVAGTIGRHQPVEGEGTTLAVLYEINMGVSTDELRQAVAHATSMWAGVPVIAYHPFDYQHLEGMNRNSHQTNARLLKYLGFRAVIDEPAQLAQTLQEIEEHGISGPAGAPPSPSPQTPPAGERGEALLGLAHFPARLEAKSLRTALEVVASLHFATDQRQAALAALAGLDRLVRADGWALYLAAEGAEGVDQLELLAARGRHESVEPPPPVGGRNGRAGRRRPAPAITVEGVTREALEKVEVVRAAAAGGHQVLAVPLVYGERVFGVLEAERTGEDRRPFRKTEAELLSALAVPLTCALANTERIAKAEQLSLTDDLTKLYNARYLRQFLTGELKRARRYNSPVAVIFLDLDDFKRVNDVHGHLTGSHVLSELAAVVLRSVRDTDIVARYGGDEFVVVLPQSKAEQAVFVAERMRERIANRAFTGGRGLQLRVTASFGVAAYPQSALSPQQLLGCADAAMYAAKAATKNCVRLAPEVPSENFREKAIS